MGAKMLGVHTLPQRYHLFLKPEDQCQILKPETENSMVLATEEGVKKAGLNPLLSSLGNTTERWEEGGNPSTKCILPLLSDVEGGREGGEMKLSYKVHLFLTVSDVVAHPVAAPCVPSSIYSCSVFQNTCICHLPLLCAGIDLFMALELGLIFEVHLFICFQ